MKRSTFISALAGFGLIGLSALTYGAPPPVNTPIGNQAKATFSDESGVEREVFSNTVITRVAQIYAVSLQQDNTQLGTPGALVNFPHTVTNHGNGIDSFDLDLVLGGINLLDVKIFADANQDGDPDDQNAITQTPPIEAGGSYSFVISGRIPPAATLGDPGTVTVTAASVGAAPDTVVSNPNLDTFTVTNNAVMNVQKMTDIRSGIPGTNPVTFTLRYNNIGNSSATNFTLTDRLPAGMTYVPDSARWSSGSSGGNGVVLTDGAGGDPVGIDYEYDFNSGTATFVIAEVPRGTAGFVTFEVTIDEFSSVNPALPLPPGILTNVASYEFETGGEPKKGPFPSNPVEFTVEAVPGVTLTPPAAALPPVAAGSTVRWSNIVVNTGNGEDTFDIIIESNTFPTGTTFQILQQGGLVPMIDSNGNGIPDTGRLQPGESYEVVLQAVLPMNISGGSVPYTVTKAARSTVAPEDPRGIDRGDDILQGITAASVNLTDNHALDGAAPRGTELIAEPVLTSPEAHRLSANPGESVTFALHANNTGDRPDSYNILADMTLPFGTTNDMLPGWSALFRNTGSTVITSTPEIRGVVRDGNGDITAHYSSEFSLEVRVPANALPGEYPVFVRIQSPLTGAVDHIKYTVVVNTVRRITLENDNVGQAYPGGSIDYVHILTNHGNVVEGANGGSVIVNELTDSFTGFGSVVYYDEDDNGVFDASDPIFTGTLADIKGDGLAPGESIRLFVKVFAPLGVPTSATNQTKLTIRVSGLVDGIDAPDAVVNTDTTSIVRGDLEVEKFQAIDADLDGDVLDTEFLKKELTAPPGAYIIYKIVVTNSGSADATGIFVYDATPTNTTYLHLGAKGQAVVTGGTENTVTHPAAGQAGTLTFNVGDLKPQEKATIYFGVKIDGLD